MHAARHALSTPRSVFARTLPRRGGLSEAGGAFARAEVGYETERIPFSFPPLSWPNPVIPARVAPASRWTHVGPWPVPVVQWPRQAAVIVR